VPSPDLTPFQRTIAERLSGIYLFVGTLVMPRDVYDGMVIVQSSEARAEEVVRWARNNKRVWKFLVNLLNMSDFGTMLIGHAWMGYAMLSHHRGGGNEMLLRKLGYAPEQVLAPFVAAQQAMNGNMPDGTTDTGAFAASNP
jgi:hypothetical protein